MHRIRLLLTILIGLATIVLAVANRHDVAFSLSPLPWEIELPLYALLLLTFALGVGAGGIAMWTGRMRRNRRQRRKLAKTSAKDDVAPSSDGADTKLVTDT